MFQVEPVLWLQAMETPGLTWFMSKISELGYTPVYASLLIVLIFGVRLKQGFFVFLALIICGILTGSLKRSFMFPRPTDVDMRVIEPGFQRPPLLVDGGGATRFWELPSKEAIAASRVQNDGSYGLPSGHVSAATAFFLALAFFFRSRGVLVFAICWILLMALSRMYLGRHFVADVLGGICVGVFAVAVTAFLVQPLKVKVAKGSNAWPLMRWTIFVIPLVILAPFIELLDKEDVGRLCGILATYAVLLRIGIPPDKANIWKRVARVLLVVLVYIFLDRLIDPIMDSIEESAIGLLVGTFLITVIPFIVTILFARRLKLYEST